MSQMLSLGLLFNHLAFCLFIAFLKLSVYLHSQCWWRNTTFHGEQLQYESVQSHKCSKGGVCGAITPRATLGPVGMPLNHVIVRLFLLLIFSQWGFQTLWFVNINNSYPNTAFLKSRYLQLPYSTVHSMCARHTITFLNRYLNPGIFYYSRRQLLEKLRGTMIAHKKPQEKREGSYSMVTS